MATSSSSFAAVLFTLIAITLAYKPTQLFVTSAGFTKGNIAKIEINGEDVLSGIAYRGINVAVISEHGTLITRAAFDTHGDAHASTRLIATLAAVRTNSYIVLAVKDSAQANLKHAAKHYIKTLGGSLINSLKLRDSYILIIQKSNPKYSKIQRLSAGYVSVHTTI